MSDDRLADIKARRPHMCDSITREHIEWLIARVEELEAERTELRQMLTSWADDNSPHDVQHQIGDVVDSWEDE